jgi:membrane-associated phospholipid phosphatase
MWFLTDFADLAVVLPLAVCAVVGLGLAGWWRGAVVWGGAIAGTLAVMLGLKLLCLACVTGGERAFSPSGHVAAATVLFGGAVALALRRWLGLWRAVLLGGLPVAGLMAASRLLVQVHVPAEVAAGAAVGMGALTIMVWRAGLPPFGLRVERPLLLALPVLALVHGARLPAEAGLKRLAGWAPARLCACLR